MEALIGHTGFVGGNLLRQRPFDCLYNSKNIEDICGRSFELVVCAAIPAAKWLANKDPAGDWQNIQRLIGNLAQVTTGSFVLISTIDVYPALLRVDETTDPTGQPNHPYGRHRLAMESFVRERFPRHHILRLPGLFGPGLKKNVIYDLLHDNCLDLINPDGCYQYYCLDNLWADVAKAMSFALPILNVSSEPISTREIIHRFFPGKIVGSQAGPAAVYDFRSIYAHHWGGANGYLYGREQVLIELGAFIAGVGEKGNIP
jgi:hypothetical protein